MDRHLSVLILSLCLSAAARAEVCTEGRGKGPETHEHCCWPGQAWSVTRNTCVGIPTQCPSEHRVEGEACIFACATGQAVSADTQGHCCWPTQVWSKTRSTCVGIPQCPAGMAASGEACVAQAGAAAAPIAQEPPPPVAATAAAPPAAGEVPVKFEPMEEGNAYSVEARTASGKKTCKLPCSLTLLPGEASLHVTGDAEFDKDVDIPSRNAVAKVAHTNKWLMFGMAGGMVALSGVIFWVLVNDVSRDGFKVINAVEGGLITLCLAVGTLAVVMAFVRKGIVDVSEAPEPEKTSAVPVKLEGLTVAPVRGGAVAGASLRF